MFKFRINVEKTLWNEHLESFWGKSETPIRSGYIRGFDFCNKIYMLNGSFLRNNQVCTTNDFQKSDFLLKHEKIFCWKMEATFFSSTFSKTSRPLLYPSNRTSSGDLVSAENEFFEHSKGFALKCPILPIPYTWSISSMIFEHYPGLGRFFRACHGSRILCC